MRILITGIHGFVGSNLVKALAKDGLYKTIKAFEEPASGIRSAQQRPAP